MAPPSAFSSVVLPEETGPATTMFLRGADAGGEEVGGLLAEQPERDELGERVGAQAEAADGADHVAVGADRRDRRGEPGAVGEARFDQRRDPVEAFAFDVLEQPFEECANAARSSVKGDVGDALDPVAGVSEDPRVAR